MKKIQLAIVLALNALSFSSFAQYLPLTGGTLTGTLMLDGPNGNVLQLRASGDPIGYIGNTFNAIGSGSKNDLLTWAYGNNTYSIWTGAANRLNVASNGYVGIGTTSPNGKLDVNGGIFLQGATNNSMPRPVVGATPISGEIKSYSMGGIAYDDGLLRLSAGGGTTGGVKSFIDLSGYSTIPDMDRNIILGTGGTERMRISTFGNVSIGTADARGYKLAVNGSAIAESVTVKLNGSWPDYVFKPNYQLLTLTQVKSFIDKNKHLPDMPSEKEVAENGINLGEMVKLQTKKIEELTLYLIEKDKQITEQKQLLTEQQLAIKSLQTQVNKLTSSNK